MDGKMNVVFITNRGGTHPNRLRYFDAIGAEYQYVDFRVRWHGTSSRLRMLISGLVCALTFPDRKRYRIFVSSDPQIPVVLMKIFGLLRKDQRIVTYLGSQTLYFTYSGFFSRYTRALYKFLLRQYDFHICNGPVQADLLRKVAGVSGDKVFENFNGISPIKREVLGRVRYNPASKNLLIIGNMYSGWRLHYKGVDLLLSAFERLKNTHSELTLTIAGEFDQSLTDLISKIVPADYRADVLLPGKVADIAPLFEDAVAYVHPSRGDALPNSLTEAMYAGVPAIASKWTGGKDILELIDRKLVCDLDPESLLSSIEWFLNLDVRDRMSYSNAVKSATSNMTEESAVVRMTEIVEAILNK